VNVDEQAITAHLQGCDGSEAERLEALRTTLRCGTQCGSCVPELRRLIARTPAGRNAASFTI
jgi:assimilatory nitrate reductase catalytic subunit